MDWQCDACRTNQFPDFELVFLIFRFRIFLFFVSCFLREQKFFRVAGDHSESSAIVGAADLGVVDWGVENVSRQEHVEPI